MASRGTLRVLVAAVTLLLAAQSAAGVGVWSQVHHDAHNSGRADFVAPFLMGTCTDWDIPANISDPSGPEVIQANGVVSLDGSYYFYVGTSPTKRVVHKIDTASGQEVASWENTFVNFGIGSVGGCAVGFNLQLQGEVLYCAFDNIVYSIDPTNMKKFWSVPFSHNVYAPLRLSANGGALLVTISNATHDSDGQLFALDPKTGHIAWNFTATEDHGKSWGLRITPAVTKSGVVFVCYGQTMVALDINSGAVIDKVTTLPFFAVLGSSPVVTDDMLSVFVQSKSDDLWRFDVSSDVAPLTLKQVWACEYQSLVPTCINFTNADALEYENLPEPWKMRMRQTPRRPGDPLVQVGQLAPGDDNRATPALGPNDESIIFPLYATQVGNGGVHSAATVDGSRNWRWLSSESSPYLGNMMSRSSPAVDQNGNIFIGMDQTDPGLQGIPPVLLALNAQGTMMWVQPGTQKGPLFNPIGLRSPLLAYTSGATVQTSVVIFARQESVTAFGAGQMCPSFTPMYECSGHGKCNCNTGTCECDALTCYSGDDCGVQNTCSGHGTCNAGFCECSDVCYSGLTCENENTCSGSGTCTAGIGCQCNSACFLGNDCSILNDCNGNGVCNQQTGKCACDTGFSGLNCEAYSPPSHGIGGGWVFFIVLCCVSVVGGVVVFAHHKKTGHWIWTGMSLPSFGRNAPERVPLATASPIRPDHGSGL